MRSIQPGEYNVFIDVVWIMTHGLVVKGMLDITATVRVTVVKVKSWNQALTNAG